MAPELFPRLCEEGSRPDPASADFPPPPDDRACASWTAHMASLFARLDAEIGPLTPLPIAPELASACIPGKVRAETWLYSSPHARRVRFTYVDGGEECQIFNAVAYPDPDPPPRAIHPKPTHSPESSLPGDGSPVRTEGSPSPSLPAHVGDAPLLGVDFLSLAKGKSVLVGVDLQPLVKTRAYLERYVDDLAAVRDSFEDLGLVEPSARFYENARYFSPAMLFARPDPAAMAASAARKAAADAGTEFPLPALEAEYSRTNSGRAPPLALDASADAMPAGGGALGVSLVETRAMDAMHAYVDAFVAALDLWPKKRDDDDAARVPDASSAAKDASPLAASLSGEEVSNNAVTQGLARGGEPAGGGPLALEGSSALDAAEETRLEAAVMEENQNIYDRAAAAAAAAATTTTLSARSEGGDDESGGIESAREPLDSSANASFSFSSSEVRFQEMMETNAREAGAEAMSEMEEVRARTAAEARRGERVLSVLETARAQDAHDAWQRERDPAVKMFAGWFGREWAERMAAEVLFPEGRAVGEVEAREHLW